jgi:hypothetical protein
MSCFASLTLSDHGGYFWKTSQQSFIEEQMTFSDTWPRSACVTTIHTSDGWKVTASAQPTLARLTDVIGGSALPTPNTLDHTGSGRMNTNANVKKWGGINSLGGMAATGLWPTPSAADTRDRGHLGTGCMNKRIKDGRQLLLSQCVSTESGLLNPKFVEWLMGLPPGYTVLND